MAKKLLVVLVKLILGMVLGSIVFAAITTYLHWYYMNFDDARWWASVIIIVAVGCLFIFNETRK